ncbi:nicotinamidase [Saccharomycopsis crataegensis]|uniref:nicotinamidase n=1 Tax=Saccharomycopsis crataegensis TaxID=43959 RepID=A0AAV5QWM0_9ASCO|nr:nicotinamidase [Saccharomycopsis crataegensis]
MPIKPKSALIVVDLQNDFLPPSGSLAVQGGREIIQPITDLLVSEDWDAIVATRDFHPKDHFSFASNWDQAPFSSKQFTHPLQVIDPNTQKVGTKTQILWPDHCVQETEGSELTDTFANGFYEMMAKEKKISSSSSSSSNSGIRDTIPMVVEVKKGYLVDREYYSAFEDTWGLHHTELHNFLTKRGIVNIYLVGLAYDFCVLNTAISGTKLNYNTVVIKDLSRSVYPDKLEETDAVYRENGIQIITCEDLKKN